MKFKDKKIGIWGFGIVGQSALRYFHNKASHISIYDHKPLTEEQIKTIKEYNATYYSTDKLQQFLDDNHYILPSPGIDLRAYTTYKHKWLAELDIFGNEFSKPIIAITGTVGKTTTTSFLSHILATAGLRIATAGNIGIGMLDMLKDTESYDYALLEVSSFQLELCRSFAPSIAVWTTFYPNHLDRHGTEQEYFDAKQNIVKHQSSESMTLLPLTLANKITMPCKGKRYFFSTHDINQGDMSVLTPSDIVFFIRDGHVIRKEGIKEEIVIHVNDLPSVILVENCIAILAILEYINIDIEVMQYAAKTFTNHGHRIEKIAIINGVDFYNDSKATIIQATYAAVQKLQSKPLILLIGGLSKGVDRSPLFPLLRGSVEHVICFGAQAQELYSYAHDAQLSAYAFPTLEEAFKQACDLAQPSYQILFSPSGSSFDLFKNYQDRGEVFKKLTLAYQQQSLF